MQKELNLIIAKETDYIELGYLNKQLINSGGSINNMTLFELEQRMLHFITTDYWAIFFEVDGIHIGYTLVSKEKNPLFIRHFLILEEYRRKGYGRIAFNKLISFFDVKDIKLTVLANNDVAKKFWKCCGLKPYEIVMHYKGQ